MARDLVGKVVGGYRLGDVLSSKGDASTVYAGEHSATGRQVAVKVFSVDFSRDKNAAARLTGEVQRATGVKHPHLVEILDVGTIEHKGKRYLYIVMERLQGETLSARIAAQAGKPLPLHLSLQIASDIGAALQAAHRQGQSHGALSAGAVFLSKSPTAEGEETVRLLGLGSAQVQAAEASAAPGTGGTKKDLRELALLLQEMLGGPSPDGGQAVLPVRLHNREVPVHVDAALRSALGDGEAQADKGFPSVSAFMAALLGNGEAVPSAGVWSADGTTPPLSPRGGLNMFWVVGVLAVVGSGIGLWFYYRAETPVQVTADLSQRPRPVDDLAGPGGDLEKEARDQGAGRADLAPPSAPDLGAKAVPVPVPVKKKRPVRTGPRIPPVRGPLDFNPKANVAPIQPAQTDKPAQQADKPPGPSAPAEETPKTPSKPKRPKRTGPPIPPLRLQK